MPRDTQSLGQRLADTNTSRFSRVTTVAGLVETLNRIGITAVVDRNSLEDEAVSLDEKLRMPAASVSLAQGMELALKELGLGWTIVKRGGAVLIASRSQIEEELINVTYDVTHLCGTADIGEPLINVITSSVDPDSWDDVGGPGSVQPIEVRGRVLFVVSNTYHVHTDLLRVLSSLRRMGGNGPFLNLRRTHRSGRSRGTQIVSVASSTPVALPDAPKKRGIALPDSGSQGPYGGFGGGMGGGMVGGMF